MLAASMRRLPWLIVLAAAAARGLPALPAGPPAGSLARDIAAVSDLYPRLEGSAGEKALLALIASRLESLGLRGVGFDFRDSDTAHSFSSCLRVDVPGARADTVILAVALNQPADAPPGRDGSINVALALDLLARAAAVPPPVSLTVLFLGAEHGDTPGYPMGSALFLRDFRPGYPVAVVVLNLETVPGRLRLRAAARGATSPPWLLSRCMRSLAAAGIPATAPGVESHALRLGLGGEQTLLEPWLAAGIPAVQLDGEYGTAPGRPAEAGQEAQQRLLERFPRFAAEFLEASVEGIPSDWDRHYLVIGGGRRPLVIGERAVVVTSVAALLSMLLYSLVFRRGLRRYVRSLRRNALRVAPILGLTFLFLLAGTGAVWAVLAARGFPRLWEYAPLEFLGLKVAVPLLLYSALYVLLRRLPFPRAGSFYTAAALLLLLADIVVVTALDISFTWYFLLAFLFVFLSALVPNRIGKLLVLLPAPWALVRALVRLFLLPALPFCRVVLLSPVWGNLLAAGVLLPFILALLRIGLLFPGTGLLRRGVREPVLAGVLAAAVGLLAVRLLTFSPFTPAAPQPVNAVQSIDERAGTNTLSVSSPAPLGKVSLTDSTGTRLLATASTALEAQLPPAAPAVRFETRSREFLGKTNLSLLLYPGASPRALSAVLTAGEDFILFDCSQPFVREGPREYRLLIGAFPPDPLPLEFTFPAGMSFTLTLTMDFDRPLLDAELSVAGAAVRTRLHLVKTISLRS